MSWRVIFGPPGTGKTRRLLREIDDCGADIKDVAFVSFTRRAITEAMSRYKVNRAQAPFFRTLHALAYSHCDVAPGQLITNMRPVGEEIGFEFSRVNAMENEPGPAEGDRALRAYNLSRATGQPFERIVKEYGIEISEFRYNLFVKSLDRYKEKNDKLEFSDLMRDSTELCPARYVFIDEAQDLTPEQWKFVRRTFANAERVTVAGDDDQAIYHWAGAHPDELLNCSMDTEVLGQSFRLNQHHFNIAERISSRISRRQPKKWKPMRETGHVMKNAEMRDLRPVAGESWLFLARNEFMVKRIRKLLLARGEKFTVHGDYPVPAKQINAVEAIRKLQSGGTITAARGVSLREFGFPVIHRPRISKADVKDLTLPGIWPDAWLYNTHPSGAQIEVTTIHQAKGAEADHVALWTDMARSSTEALSRGGRTADAEHRVWYVGVTRAKHGLFLMRPEEEHSYLID